MGRVRLRTKFLIAMLLTSAGLTAGLSIDCAATVENQVRRDLGNDLAKLRRNFPQCTKGMREAALARSAKLMADLPSLKALMTSITRPPSRMRRARCSVFPGRPVRATGFHRQFVGFHTKAPGITREQAQQLLEHRNSLDQPLQWWFAGGHLYEVVLVPIYFGPAATIRCSGWSRSATR